MFFARRKSGDDAGMREAEALPPAPLTRNSDSFQSEKLRFGVDRITVVPHWKNHLFFALFLGFGGGITYVFLQQKELKLFPVIITSIFARVGLYGMISPYFAKRPEIDLFRRILYTRGRRHSFGAAEQIPLEEFRFLRILTKRCKDSEGRRYNCYELNLVEDEARRYNLLCHGNYRKIRQDGEKLAGLLSLPLVEEGREGQSASKKVGDKAGGCFLVLFGFFFFAFGGSIFFFLSFLAMYGLLTSATWQKTPAVVVESELRRQNDDGSTLYAVNIRYAYQREGRNYESDNYDFFHRGNSYSNIRVEEMRKIVAAYPVGHRFQCLVDPDDPSRAVISRRISLLAILATALPAIFPLVGMIMIACGGRLMLKGKNGQREK